MNSFSDRILFAITVAVAVYIGIFIFLQVESISKESELNAYNEEISMAKPEDLLEIPSENIDIQSITNPQNIKNTVTDINDRRKSSNDDWSSPHSKESFDGEKAALDAQRQFQEEAKTSQYNTEVRKLIEERTKNLQSEKPAKKNTSQNPNSSSNSSNNKYDGQTLVSYDLSGRFPHQNNSWYVRNPCYTCGIGANGTVVIRIKVNKNGNVIAAEFDPSSSKNTNECMIEQGLKYAKMSRFDYSGSASESQSGKIYYSFVSQ